MIKHVVTISGKAEYRGGLHTFFVDVIDYELVECKGKKYSAVFRGLEVKIRRAKRRTFTYKKCVNLAVYKKYYKFMYLLCKSRYNY